MSMDQGGAVGEGIRLMQSGDLNGAIAQFSQALQENQANAEAWGYLGVAQCRMGDIDNGIQCLSYSAHLQPTSAHAQYNLAIALNQARRVPEALAALQQALAIDPTHANALAAWQSLNAFQAAVSNPSMDLGVSPASSGAPQASNSPSNPSTGLGGYSSAPAQTGPNYGAQQPIAYGAPASQQAAYGAAAASQAQYGAPASPQGMQYTPQQPQRQAYMAPPIGLRLGRGLGYGALYGQWWTLLNVVWMLIGSSSHFNMMEVWVGLFYAVIFTVMGCALGLIVAATNAGVGAGAGIGVAFGLLGLGLDFLIMHSPMVIINIFFWFFSGRFIGANVAARVQRPVAV